MTGQGWPRGIMTHHIQADERPGGRRDDLGHDRVPQQLGQGPLGRLLQLGLRERGGCEKGGEKGVCAGVEPPALRSLWPAFAQLLVQDVLRPGPAP